MADIDPVEASVLKSTAGNMSFGTAGATITQGQSCYLDGATTTYKLADSNSGSVGDAIRAGLFIALCAASAGQPIVVLTEDPALDLGIVLTSGATAYLSNTAGGITVTYADIASGSTVVQLGVVNTSGTLYFKPIIGGTK